MLLTAKEIAELASSLGTPGGLERVTSEIDLLSAELTKGDLPLSHQELFTMRATIASLSGAISEMRRTVCAMLAESGVAADHVG